MAVIQGPKTFKRIAIVLRGDSIGGGGGAERRFVSFFDQLVGDARDSVFLILNARLHDSLVELGYLRQQKNVIVVRDNFVFASLVFNICLLKFYFSGKFDVMHFVLIQRSLLPFFLFVRFFKNHRVRIVCSVVDYFFAYGLRSSRFDRFLFKAYTSSAALIDSLYPMAKIPGHNLSVTPCSFTDYSKFSPVEKENVIVFSGRLVREKNPMMFLSAIHWIRNNSSLLDDWGWRVRVCGSGPLYCDLLNYTMENGLGDLVTIGSCRMAEVLPASRIFVSLQEFENYPSQALLEAIASENSIVATDVGSTRLLAGSDTTVFIPVNQEALQDALIRLIERGGFPKSNLSTARHRVQSTHSLARFSDYLFGLWD